MRPPYAVVEVPNKGDYPKQIIVKTGALVVRLQKNLPEETLTQDGTNPFYWGTIMARWRISVQRIHGHDPITEQIHLTVFPY